MIPFILASSNYVHTLCMLAFVNWPIETGILQIAWLDKSTLAYTKERIPNKMLFTACWSSKYFRFHGILKFSRNVLRMPWFFPSSPSNHSPYDFEQLSNRATWMKHDIQVLNNIPWGTFQETPKKNIFKVDFIRFLFFNPYGLSCFSTTGACVTVYEHMYRSKSISYFKVFSLQVYE